MKEDMKTLSKRIIALFFVLFTFILSFVYFVASFACKLIVSPITAIVKVFMQLAKVPGDAKQYYLKVVAILRLKHNNPSLWDFWNADRQSLESEHAEIDQAILESDTLLRQSTKEAI